MNQSFQTIHTISERGRLYHTTLEHIKYWNGCKWSVEFDIYGCFDNIDPEILVQSCNIEEMKQVFVREAIEYTGGNRCNKKEVAVLLGITEQGLHKMRKRWQ